MGYAVGRVGIPFDDFCNYTLEELDAIIRAYAEAREEDRRAAWSRMRLHAVMTMQPHCKNRLSGEKLLPFPWEKKAKRRPISVPDKETARASFLERIQSI